MSSVMVSRRTLIWLWFRVSRSRWESPRSSATSAGLESKSEDWIRAWLRVRVSRLFYSVASLRSQTPLSAPYYRGYNWLQSTGFTWRASKTANSARGFLFHFHVANFGSQFTFLIGPDHPLETAKPCDGHPSLPTSRIMVPASLRQKLKERGTR